MTYVERDSILKTLGTFERAIAHATEKARKDIRKVPVGQRAGYAMVIADNEIHLANIATLQDMVKRLQITELQAPRAS